MFGVSLSLYFVLACLINAANCTPEVTVKSNTLPDFHELILEELEKISKGVEFTFEEMDDFYHRRSMRAEAAYNALTRIHSMGLAALENRCVTKFCSIAKVQEVLQDRDRTITYWTLLNCVKYNILCGDGAQLSDWGEWSECSSMCGEGVKARYRNCDRDLNWGLPCHKDDFIQTKSCEPKFNYACTAQLGKPDTWGKWSEWSDCSVQCGSVGHMTRSRTCLPHDSPLFCVGRDFERLACSGSICNVDGKWGEWGVWINNCETTFCGSALQYRMRLCNNPRPKGTGKRCEGSSSITRVCPPDNKCLRENFPIYYFTDSSALHFPTQPTSGFFSFFIQFKPISGGTLFYFIDRPRRTAASVEISNLQATDWNNNNVIVSIGDDGRVKSQISFDSDLVNMELGNIEFGAWNTLRVSVVSDVVHTRLNDLDNMMATLQQSPVSTPITHNSSNNIWWENFLTSENATRKKRDVPSLKIPLPTGNKLRKTKQVSVKFKPKFSIGNSIEEQPGFTGYVSQVVYNFQEFLLRKETHDSDFSTLNEPLSSIGVSRLGYSGFNNEDINFPCFDGKHRMVLPRIMSWWEYRKTVIPEHFTTKHASTLQISFKPYNFDSLLLWNQGEHDDLTQIKILVERGSMVKFTSIRKGNIVHIRSSHDLKMRRWNELLIIFFRSGEITMSLNHGISTRTKLPRMYKNDIPGPIWHVGGPKKSVLDDLFAKSNVHPKPFRGCIRSFIQDNVEFINFQPKMVNLKEMLPSKMTSKPIYWRYWYMVASTKSDKVLTSIESDNLDAIQSNSQVRQINCYLPVTPDITEPPVLNWFKDDVPIDDHPMFVIRKTLTQEQVQSNLFLLPSLDSSRQLSGVYSCVAKVDHSYFVVINHVVSYLHEGISNPSGLGATLNYITDSLGIGDNLLVFVVLGAVAGGSLLLIVLFWVYSKLCGKQDKSYTKLNTKPNSKTENIVDEEPSTSHKHHRRHQRKGTNHHHGNSRNHHSSSASRRRPRPSTGRRQLSSDDSDELLAELMGRELDEVDFYEEKKFLF